MKSMQRNLAVFVVLFVSILVTTMIKHVPLIQLINFSSFFVLFGCLVAMSFSIGFENVLLALLGRSPEAAESLIRATFLTTCLWAMVCAASAFGNRGAPDLIGPAVLASITSAVYGLAFAGYLGLVNKVTKVSSQYLFFSGSAIFINVSLTMFVLYVVKPF